MKYKSGVGFTIIELLVVISIIVLLSALLILYSRTGESQIILFKEQVQVISALNRAKSLTIEMFQEPEPSCAFGVHFSETENEFLIFRDLATDCQDSDNKYSDSAELFEKYELDPRIKFKDLGLTDVVFIPPDPKTRIDNDPNKNEASISLETRATGASLGIKINNAGQITTQ